MPGFNIGYIYADQRRRIIADLEARGGGYLTPIIEALAAGVTLMTLPPNRQAFAIPAHCKGGAWLAVVQDDNERAQGPAGYHLNSLRRLLRGADIIGIMIGTPANAAYQAVANIAIGDEQFALGGMCVAIIETQEPERASWLNFADRRAPQASKVVTAPDTKVTNRQIAWEAFRELGSSKH